MLSAGTFIASLPVAFVVVPSTLSYAAPTLPGRLLWLGPLGLTLGVGLLAFRLGRSLRPEGSGQGDRDDRQDW